MEFQAQIIELQVQLEILTQERDEYKIKAESTQNQHELLKKIDDLMQINQILELQLVQQDPEDVNILKAQISEKDQQLQQLSIDYEELSHSYQNLLQNQQFTDPVNDQCLTEQLIALQQEVNHLSLQNEDLKQKLTSSLSQPLSNEIQALQQNISQLKEQNNQLQVNNEQLVIDNNQFQDDNEQLTSNMEQLQNDNQQLQKNIKELNAITQQQETKINKSNSQILKILKIIDEKNETINALKSESRKLKTLFEKQNERENQNFEQIKSLECEVGELKVQIESLNQSIAIHQKTEQNDTEHNTENEQKQNDDGNEKQQFGAAETLRACSRNLQRLKE
ncbi:Hypothetical_protein [Hexamita inflata]|uniref:Hypothetical_protein n=1 Tax=Hexamita inflata TaxID=28002 RepID=A0AA86PAI5_9EUKA|nr:Hypothetical protein HINF_LOCUS22836 [Hexamita inflata]